MGCVSRECLRSRWRQLVVVALLVALLLAFVVDLVTKSCVLVESEGQRVQRLFCDGLLNATDDGTVVPGQQFACGATNGTDEEWMIGEGQDGSELQCEQDSACLSVGFQAILDWISDNPGLGWLVTASVYALLTVALIPGSVLTIGSGVAFGTAFGLGKGTLVGATAVLVGAVIGSTLAFLLGRYLLKEVIERWAEKFKVLAALDSALATKGFQITLLMRLSPVIPFNAFNFVMGSTSCSLRNYFWATAIGIVPGTFAFVFIGALIGSAAFEDSNIGTGGSDGSSVIPDQCEDDPKEDTIRLVIWIVGGVATVLAVVLITMYARKQFQKIEEAAEEEYAKEHTTMET